MQKSWCTFKDATILGVSPLPKDIDAIEEKESPLLGVARKSSC